MTQTKTTREVKKSRQRKKPRLLLFVNNPNKGESMAKPARIIQEETIPNVVPKRINQTLLKKFDPLTPAQIQAFSSYKDGKNLVLHGSAGTGKTFISLYLAMKEVLSRESPYEKVVVVRSAVPTRDLGFMPGTKEEKEMVYELPYYAIFKEIFNNLPGNGLVEKLKEQKLYEFISTSYVRGVTFHKSIIIVDEMENLVFHELDSVITRLGNDCKVIFCGDYKQSDLHKQSERDGLNKFIKILDSLYDFRHVEFTEEDIVRSSLVRDYIICKNKLGFN